MFLNVCSACLLTDRLKTHWFPAVLKWSKNLTSSLMVTILSLAKRNSCLKPVSIISYNQLGKDGKNLSVAAIPLQRGLV